MTRQDVIGVKEHTHLNQMHYEPLTMKLVCGSHNQSLFGGSLPEKGVTRNARCWYCIHPEEGAD